MGNAPGLAGLFSQISPEWSGQCSHTCGLESSPLLLWMQGRSSWESCLGGAGAALAPLLFLFLTGPHVVASRHVDSCFL